MQRSLRRRSSRGGFTLIEVLVVVVMIAILATLVAPNVFRHVGGAKRSTARSQVEMTGAALDAFRLDVGRYPTAAEGLEALNTAPAGGGAAGWNGPYLKKKVPLDPWKRAYVFRSPGEASQAGYDLLSLGADRRPGGEGEDADVVSWE